MENIIINYEMIKRYEKENNLSSKQFCEKCNISWYAYSKIVKKEMVKVRVIYKIAVLLDVKLMDLLLFNQT